MVFYPLFFFGSPRSLLNLYNVFLFFFFFSLTDCFLFVFISFCVLLYGKIYGAVFCLVVFNRTRGSGAGVQPGFVLLGRCLLFCISARATGEGDSSHGAAVCSFCSGFSLPIYALLDILFSDCLDGTQVGHRRRTFPPQDVREDVGLVRMVWMSRRC